MNRFLSFDHVPLVTPNGDVLVQDLTFEVNEIADLLNKQSLKSINTNLGSFWYELSCLWTQWMWEKLTVPNTRRGLSVIELFSQLLFITFLFLSSSGHCLGDVL